MLAILEKRGEHLLISHLGKDSAPTIAEDIILLEVGSELALIETRSQQERLLTYIRKSLNNYNITLQITVNKEIAPVTAYTPEEKYLALKEQNPLLETFVRELGLQF